MTCLLPKLHGAVSSWNLCSSQRMIAQHIPLYRLIGLYEACDNRVAFFDNRIVYADAPSYQTANLSWEAIARRAACEKKRKYALVAEELRGSITPLVCSTDCVAHVEYAAFQRRLASRLAVKWDRPYSREMSWVLLKSQFAIIRAVDLRLRGRRHCLFGLSVADGLGLWCEQCLTDSAK